MHVECRIAQIHDAHMFDAPSLQLVREMYGKTANSSTLRGMTSSAPTTMGTSFKQAPNEQRQAIAPPPSVTVSLRITVDGFSDAESVAHTLHRCPATAAETKLDQAVWHNSPLRVYRYKRDIVRDALMFSLPSAAHQALVKIELVQWATDAASKGDRSTPSGKLAGKRHGHRRHDSHESNRLGALKSVSEQGDDDDEHAFPPRVTVSSAKVPLAQLTSAQFGVRVALQPNSRLRQYLSSPAMQNLEKDVRQALLGVSKENGHHRTATIVLQFASCVFDTIPHDALFFHTKRHHHERTESGNSTVAGSATATPLATARTTHQLDNGLVLSARRGPSHDSQSSTTDGPVSGDWVQADDRVLALTLLPAYLLCASIVELVKVFLWVDRVKSTLAVLVLGAASYFDLIGFAIVFTTAAFFFQATKESLHSRQMLLPVHNRTLNTMIKLLCWFRQRGMSHDALLEYALLLHLLYPKAPQGLLTVLVFSLLSLVVPAGAMTVVAATGLFCTFPAYVWHYGEASGIEAAKGNRSRHFVATLLRWWWSCVRVCLWKKDTVRSFLSEPFFVTSIAKVSVASVPLQRLRSDGTNMSETKRLQDRLGTATETASSVPGHNTHYSSEEDGSVSSRSSSPELVPPSPPRQNGKPPLDLPLDHPSRRESSFSDDRVGALRRRASAPHFSTSPKSTAVPPLALSKAPPPAAPIPPARLSARAHHKSSDAGSSVSSVRTDRVATPRHRATKSGVDFPKVLPDATSAINNKPPATLHTHLRSASSIPQFKFAQFTVSFAVINVQLKEDDRRAAGGVHPVTEGVIYAIRNFYSRAEVAQQKLQQMWLRHSQMERNASSMSNVSSSPEVALDATTTTTTNNMNNNSNVFQQVLSSPALMSDSEIQATLNSLLEDAVELLQRVRRSWKAATVYASSNAIDAHSTVEEGELRLEKIVNPSWFVGNRTADVVTDALLNHNSTITMKKLLPSSNLDMDVRALALFASAILQSQRLSVFRPPSAAQVILLIPLAPASLNLDIKPSACPTNVAHALQDLWKGWTGNSFGSHTAAVTMDMVLTIISVNREFWRQPGTTLLHSPSATNRFTSRDTPLSVTLPTTYGSRRTTLASTARATTPKAPTEQELHAGTVSDALANHAENTSSFFVAGSEEDAGATRQMRHSNSRKGLYDQLKIHIPTNSKTA